MSAEEAVSVTPVSKKKDNEERVSVASNWTLIWWRFKKHRLALICTGVLIVLYMVVLVPEFFATEEPEFSEARQAFIPPRPLHLFDEGRLAPWVPGVTGKRNPTTLRMEWQVDPNVKIPVAFFTAGYPYKIFGLIETNIHLVGPASGDPTIAWGSWAPIGWGAMNGRA
jgi:peptide/nickel transport system permease protein